MYVKNSVVGVDKGTGQMSRKTNKKKQKLSKNAGKSRYTRRRNSEKDKIKDLQS
jgi:hypothetical protein